jgi:hypothetical protein
LEDKDVRDFYIKFPIVFGLGRKKGQQTRLSKVRNFIYSLNTRHPIHTLAYDNFQTEELAQEMKLLGIKTRYISVEKDKHYLDFKNALCSGKIELPDNKRLYREFKCLRLMEGNKVDHSDMEALDDGTTSEDAVNAKDQCDAVVRCYAIIRANIAEALDVPLENSEYHTNYWMDSLTNLTQIREEQKLLRQYATQCHMPGAGRGRVQF